MIFVLSKEIQFCYFVFVEKQRQSRNILSKNSNRGIIKNLEFFFKLQHCKITLMQTDNHPPVVFINLWGWKHAVLAFV